MKEEFAKQDALLETTDYLEAVSTLKAMKNLFFFIIVIFLLAAQTCLWLTTLNGIRFDRDKADDSAAVQLSSPSGSEAGPAAVGEKTEAKIEKSEAIEKIEKTARALASDVNSPPPERKARPLKLSLKSSHITTFIRICNFVLIFSAFVYSLTILIGLKVSLVGRLGGINHITRALFLSIFAMAFLLPWQVPFKGVMVGAIYTPAELFSCLSGYSDTSIAQKLLMYLRFCGPWILTISFYLAAQVRTIRWSRTMLRRLGIIA